MKKFTMLLLAIVFAVTTTAYAGRDMVQVKGSDTLVNLVQSWAENYSDETGKFVSITGGGSGTGIAALLDGRTAIANSSRKITTWEVDMAKDRGIDVREIAVAIDGLCVIVNKDNPLKSLDLEQLGHLFKGDVKNWKELGGSDAQVTLYGRQSNSGTFIFFQKTVLKKKDYAPTMNRMNGNAQIVEAIRADKSAIGYVGIGYVKDENGKVIEGLYTIDVASKKGQKPASPLDDKSVMSGQYPLARPLFQYIAGKPEGNALDFLNYELSGKGQKQAKELGFYPIGPELVEKNKKAIE